MRIKNDLFIDLAGNMTKFIKDLLIYTLPLRYILGQQGKIFLDGDLPRVKKFLHNTHELNKFLGDGLQPGRTSGSSKHLDIAVDKICNLLDGIKSKTEVMGTHKDVEDEVLVDAKDALKVGLQREGLLYLEPATCINHNIR